MPWLQLRISAQRDSVPSIENALLNQGALSVTFEDSADEPIFEPALGETPLWQDTRITGLFEAESNTKAILKSIVDNCHLEPSTCQWQILEDKDWEREWMNNYHPIQCAENFWICPSWTPPPNPNAVNLMLDPGLAFGTGTHPTTFLCLQWAANAELKGAKVVDYGCGSGILGIAALLLGANNVVGTDIDPQALLATAENVDRNHLKREQFPVFFPDKCPQEKVDVVFANILAGPLVELAPTLCDLLLPGGKICLSGILNTQRDAIVDAYSSVIHIDEINEHDNWLCVIGHKP